MVNTKFAKPIIIITNLVFSFLLVNSQIFTCGTSSVTDIDGNVYHTVQIGSQCWMKENIRTTRYANGKSGNVHEIIGSPMRASVNIMGRLQVQIFLPRIQTLHVNIYDIVGRVLYHTDLICDSGSSILDCSV